MFEPSNGSARPTDPIGRALYATVLGFAIAGGSLCFAMAALITVSVTGRYLIATPVPGDYDLIAILSGCAVFAFLPYCQLIRGNVVVDFFTANISRRSKAVLDALGDLFYLLIAILFTWRFFFGALELRASGEVLANFNFYRWWTTPFDIICMIVLIAVIAYTLVRGIVEIGRDQDQIPPAPATRPSCE